MCKFKLNPAAVRSVEVLVSLDLMLKFNFSDVLKPTQLPYMVTVRRGFWDQVGDR